MRPLAELERFADSVDAMHRPGVYCLALQRPDDVLAAWDEYYENRPSYIDQLQAAERVLYVGAAADVLARLEDHADGDVRTTALTEICTVESLRNVWWFDSKDRAFERESGLAVALQYEYPTYYVHQR